MIRVCVLIILACWAAGAGEKQSDRTLSDLERYIQEASQRAADAEASSATPGSLFRPGGRLSDLARDLKASQIDDLVTIVVSEKASAAAKGTTASSRKSSAKNSLDALFGPLAAGGRLANLAKMGGESQLDGQGETSRETVLTTTLSARVSHVLPNGYLVVEGHKEVVVNSERQLVTVRGVVRPTDISPANTVRSDRLAQMEVHINGKGVVGDAIRRPFFLYRLLLGLLPF